MNPAQSNHNSNAPHVGQEEQKAHALIEQGYDGSFNGPAYAAVDFQNVNKSVRVTDAFMRKAGAGLDKHRQGQKQDDRTQFALTSPATGETLDLVQAEDVLLGIADGTHFCGAPGLQYKDTVDKWHTVPNTAPNDIVVQPGEATVLTPRGIRSIAGVSRGDVIWSGRQWTKVTGKISAGVVTTYRYVTTAGCLVGRLGAGGESAEGLAFEVTAGPVPADAGDFDAQAVVDGWVLGDGSYHAASKLIYLNVGDNDGAILQDALVAPLLGDYRPGVGHYAWEVQTTLVPSDIPRTYERKIPERYRKADSRAVRSFLRGLYSANGSVIGGRITLKAASLQVIRDVQEMLSSIGIPSYYTTNKAKSVKFKNGTYPCRTSYDLNVTRGRKDFVRLVGFVHPYKQERALEAARRPERVGGTKPFELKTREEIGERPVFSLSVDAPEQSYWTGGLLVSRGGATRSARPVTQPRPISPHGPSSKECPSSKARPPMPRGRHRAALHALNESA